ncbi:MAG: hypothetical protein GX251_10770 [Firmicutes bacterium]|nr:hypothetical protein [Bacillota bacterium]
MKSRVWSLYRALLNVNYGWSAAKYYYLRKKQRIWEPIVIGVSIAPAAGFVVWLAWTMTEQLYAGGLSFGQPHLPLVTGTLATAVLSLFFGFFYVLSAFYFSNDLPVLLPLPLGSGEILLAKLGVVLTGQYLLNAFVLVPMGIRYGMLAEAGLGYAVSALLSFLILPVISLVIAGVLAVLLMRLVNLSRYKDQLTWIGGIGLLVLVFAFTFWLQNNVQSDDPMVLMELLMNQADGLIREVGKIFPPSVWAAQAMAYANQALGWLNLLYLILAGAVSLAVLYFLGEKVFLQGVLAGLEGTRGGSRRKQASRDLEVRNAFWTLVSTERKLFLRDPNFALNGLVGYVLFPVMALLPVFGKNLGNNPFDLLSLDQLHPLLAAGGVALFFLVMSGLSLIPSTTFSREGRYLWIMRSLPLSLGQVIGSRVAAAQLINTAGCLLGVLPIAYISGWGVLPVILGAILGVLLASGAALLLTLLDLSRPMLDWVNPIKAVKSNFNGIVGAFGTFGLAFLLGALFYFNWQTETLWLIPLELLLAAALLTALAVLLVRRWAPALWARL